jgi:SAM-dependent methyltransferase
MHISRTLGVVAPELGWVPPLRFLLRRHRILRLLAEPRLGRLVEVGCGAGALLHELAGRCAEAVGIEQSERARSLAAALGRAGGGKQTIVSAADAAWPGDRDLVCAFDVLEHIEHDAEAIEEWVRWLTPHGRLCISVPAHRRRWGAGDEWAGHWRRYDRSDIESLLVSKGLAITHIECYGFPLGNLTEWVGERYYRKALLERTTAVDKEAATSESGVDRAYYLKRLKLLDSPLGRSLVRAANAMQDAASDSSLGVGYLVIARKP